MISFFLLFCCYSKVHLQFLSSCTVCTCFANPVLCAQLQWLWEQAMRKLAGCLSIETLHLSHLSYCVDWRLLRTLQVAV